MQLYAVSVDTPYRLTGFALEHGLDRTIGLSDYRPERSLGRAWGLLVEEDQELCRACVVLDPAGHVGYVQIAGDTWEHVDYDDVLAQLRRAVDAGSRGAVAVLFTVLALGLLVIAVELWRNGLWPGAIGAAAIAAWMATVAWGAFQRRRRR